MRWFSQIGMVVELVSQIGLVDELVVSDIVGKLLVSWLSRTYTWSVNGALVISDSFSW